MLFRSMIYFFLTGELSHNYDAVRHELIREGWATGVTRTSAPLTESWSFGGANWAGKDPGDHTSFHYFNADGDLTKTAGLQVVQGRTLDPEHYPTDSTGVLLNESAMKAMGFRDPIGQVINKDTGNAGWHVVGVVRNFILTSPYENVPPMIIQGPRATWFNLFHVKLNEAHSTAEDLAGVERVLKQYNPLYPFEYHFVDEQYARKFDDEQATGKLTAFFAGLTIFISCLGLFGLAAYMAENRIKEIGVRKVLGASVAGIATLLSKDFVLLVGIAILLASPVAWWAMDKWLAAYPYHVAISLWVFVSAGFGAIGIAVATVSFQAIRAAMANPVKSLRSE